MISLNPLSLSLFGGRDQQLETDVYKFRFILKRTFTKNKSDSKKVEVKLERKKEKKSKKPETKMKTSTLIAVCAVAAIAAMFTEAQMVLPAPPPIMPAFGALPFMGGLGFGLGGLGLLGGLGFGRLGLGLGLLGRKKREIAGADAVNITISTQTSAICAEIA